MDRPIIYDESQARDYDPLHGWREACRALAALAQDLLGSTGPFVTGLSATPTAPASLTVNIAAGSIYAQAALDATAYGALGDDTTMVVQQGFAAAQSVVLTTSGLSSGQSRYALIWAEFSQSDTIPDDDPTAGLLNYIDTTNPDGPPWSGPNNNNTPQNTRREGVCTIGVTYGNVAASGSEAPPNAPGSAVGLYLVDLAFGQTTVTSGDILVAGPNAGSNVPANYPQAPFLAGLVAAGQYCQDVGSANSYVVGLVGSVPTGSPVRVKIANTNTGASTLNGTGIVNPDGSALVAGQLRAGGIYAFVPDGTHYQLVSPSLGQTDAGPFAVASTQNITVPVWATRLLVHGLWGGGGGSGGPDGINGSASGGGGGAGFCSGSYAVTPGAAVPVTIGVGGAPGVNGTDGTAGTTSSIGSLCTATGGGGGKGATGGASGLGGAGGTGSGGTFFNFHGLPGTPGAAFPASGGGGGASFMSPCHGVGGINGNGDPGVYPGAGGAGTASNGSSAWSGGAGGPGYAILEWLP